MTALRRTLAVVSALTVGTVASTSCGGDPFAVRWQANPDTVLLYSLARPELNLPSGFSFNSRVVVRVEAPSATGVWDVALDTRDGALVFLPPGALGVESKAAIATLEGLTFGEVVEAPADTAVYVSADPVPVRLNTIYVVRTGRTQGAFGSRCVHYAKLKPLEMDMETETLTFMFDASPVCNSRRLIPPD